MLTLFSFVLFQMLFGELVTQRGQDMWWEKEEDSDEVRLFTSIVKHDFH